VTALDILELDAADESSFTTAVAPLFEGASGFLVRLAAARPFGTWPRLCVRARVIAHAMPAPEQIELINAHPRLGAPPASMSALSFQEQGHDREASAAAAAEVAGESEIERQSIALELDRLNAAYEARFGFRYCVLVAGRSREALLPDIAAALSAGRETELHRALDAVVDIAIARLESLGAGR